MRNFLESSNPALTGGNLNSGNPYAYREGYTAADVRPTGATVQGVVNKTALLAGIAIAAGAGGYALVMGPLAGSAAGLTWIIALAACVVTFGLYFVVVRNPARAKGLAPVYAVIEGAFLGLVTGVLDSILADMQVAVMGGLALQAFVITASITVAMLALYYTRILRPTKTFVAVVSTLTLGIFIMYMVNLAMVIFGGAGLPFFRITSALEGGTAALIGLGINILILIVASLWLIIDFKVIEDAVNSGEPKHMEWYCSFGLMVTLAWIYFEAVKLAFRVALLMNRE